MKHKSKMLFLFHLNNAFAWVALFSALAWGNESRADHLGYGIWSGGSVPNVQVKLDPSVQAVMVTLDRYNYPPPKTLGITFYDASGKKTALELRGDEPWVDPTMDSGGSNPGMYTGMEPGMDPFSHQTRFSGELSPANESFIGFEVQVPLSTGAPVVFRSQDMNRIE